METNRWTNMVDKYGSEELARQEMARRAAKSSRNNKGTGGFAALTPEERTAVARKAAQRRWSNVKRVAESDSEPSKDD